MFIMSLLERRAAYSCWNKFHINRFELWMLMSLSALMLLYRAKSMGKRQLFDTITGNGRIKRQFEGYFRGLLTKGFIKEVQMHNGKIGYLLTPLASRVLNEFERRLDELEKGQIKRSELRKAPRERLTIEELSNLTIDDLGSRYKAIL